MKKQTTIYHDAYYEGKNNFDDNNVTFLAEDGTEEYINSRNRRRAKYASFYDKLDKLLDQQCKERIN